MENYEKLGAFYLGRVYDYQGKKATEDLLLYDAKDLTTHGVCVGMTGSGKTGLSICLLEEAAIDAIPAIALDLKGDLGNLLLTFPDLQPRDFRPWVDVGEASAKGQSPDEYAGAMAKLWKKGLADWGQTGERIARFRESVDLAIYTPGSTSGLPLTVMRSFDAPAAALLEDPDALRESIQTAVSGLLALLGMQADPIRSREHILLSNILNHAWTRGRNLDLASLIGAIQSPPFDKVGVFDLESFYSAKDRFDLAMLLNNLLASPGFAAWMRGEPLDISRLLYTPQGRPRLSIISIAHLSDAERMFFVTLLLNEMVGWMRVQPGTTSLRAILYMDEIFGYFPPTAAPPSKAPMLTLLKQARAYGLGVLLATQNPVDLDYKGLSNAGTWFIGRLQTERDKARVLEGLESASAGVGKALDKAWMDNILSGLGNRVFLMHNVHEDEPELFQTRWAMSYLRGPLTRQQIATLMHGRGPDAASVPARDDRASQRATMTISEPNARGAPTRPVLPPHVSETFLEPARSGASGGVLLYRPSLLACARLHFVSARSGVDQWNDICLVAPLPEGKGGVVWDEASILPAKPDCMEAPEPEARFAGLPASALSETGWKAWQKSFAAHLYQNRSLVSWKCRELKLSSEQGESEGDFRARLSHASREQRDAEVEKLRGRYGPKLQRLKERIRKAQARVEREESQYKQQKMQTAISFGATLLGAVFGRKIASRSSIGRATTAVRGVGRATREKDDIARALEDVETYRRQLGELEDAFQEATRSLQETFKDPQFNLEETRIRPRKSDITVVAFALLWAPWRVDQDGIAEPAFSLQRPE